MDKRPFDGCGLDLLAFENADQSFFIETKCTFAQDPRDVWASAYRALAQTETLYASLAANPGDLSSQFLACHGYIVHFLNSVPHPEDRLLPAWLRARYPRGRPVNPADLEAFYRDNREPRYNSSVVLKIWDELRVYAIVVQLKPGPID